MKTFLIKPAPGRMVRDPDTLEFLKDEGEEKPFTPYWCRRFDDGDVIEFDPEKEPPAVTAGKAKAADADTVEKKA
ncbi:DUF2635 domain-containing protein [Salmonella enterica subsp. enterica]|nr:hypothetical protein [Salmonella enterica subsp. enterica serovar Poona]EBW2889673.1 hypothetical protein [Salmonella enterica subsp. enterica serovar Poona]ECD3711290.1 DUF2635 domain-containing protein [Salmonella enterica subsp. enterica serovar Poona]ECG6029190.1 DUF2635 domain-containing protein [Salmonella enterica subsp. enterica serovar Poona]ECH9318917.1 DUF2635 domain-containing protein [Salmonella enterica subsp. enterica serovar Poona]